MKGISLWEITSSPPIDYPDLSENIEVDVAIIGGGITGISAAAALLNAGKKVIILEAHKIGGITTSHSTGNLYVPVQPYYQSIVSSFDLATAKQIAQSRQLAIDLIEKNVTSHSIDCQFHRRPWYAYTTSKDDEQKLQKEVETLKQIGMDIDYATSLPFDLKFTKAAVMPAQARFNPLQYVRSMAALLAEKGCLIFENTRVTAIKETEYCTLFTEKAEIHANSVFMATHTPLDINLTQMFTAPYRSYVVGAYLEGNNYPEGHLWELSTPTRIFSTHSLTKSEPEILLISGSHHKTGQGQNMSLHFADLESSLKEHFSISEIAYCWSAQHFQSADKIPYIGLANRTTKNIYMATGYFADGLTYGTMAGLLVANLILHKTDPFSETYFSNRFTPLSSLGFLTKENLNVFAQYAKDLPLGNGDNLENIQSGEGKIVEINREKWAVCRDSSNQLHMVSAVCTHMKCIVNWNNAEQTWDCPCHGSRFTPEGEVLEGPATYNLERKEYPKGKKE
ncbi:FAD-dependent oxidoreductase [Legionella hackeliae]|uniref:Putative FAD dependent oxidoreductase n=1 Tax=Legionella hackeliae TaxID=449 RepID=A0A0A8UW93_LEGHA|nr:FAD-dependent oxidoreductase [Legionella hackeliae]KTD09649.1 Gamma-glutamylputrescine oxidoreductase [Legionella hackeliae]CEK11034.1 putative FAD dependent oxidoreductase [Legionella hackeliae]STX47778.1 Gamma-glutamylputrescine oxidoreductase [Legionella hackeliae]